METLEELSRGTLDEGGQVSMKGKMDGVGEEDGEAEGAAVGERGEEEDGEREEDGVACSAGMTYCSLSAILAWRIRRRRYGASRSRVSVRRR